MAIISDKKFSADVITTDKQVIENDNTGLNIKYSEQNGLIYDKGDTSLLLNPFDNYHMFTLYQSNQGSASIPIDLTNCGTVFLTFIAKNSEIRIEEFTNTNTKIDKVNGQVLFKITKEDARSILALSDNTFYISTKFINDNYESDETVLYTGRWANYSTYNESSNASKINAIKEELDIERAQVDELRKQLNSAYEEIESYKKQVNSLNEQMTSMIMEYSGSVSSVQAIDLDEYLSSMSEQIQNNVAERAGLSLKSLQQAANSSLSSTTISSKLK